MQNSLNFLKATVPEMFHRDLCVQPQLDSITSILQIFHLKMYAAGSFPFNSAILYWNKPGLRFGHFHVPGSINDEHAQSTNKSIKAVHIQIMHSCYKWNGVCQEKLLDIIILQPSACAFDTRADRSIDSHL